MKIYKEKCSVDFDYSYMAGDLADIDRKDLNIRDLMERAYKAGVNRIVVNHGLKKDSCCIGKNYY